MYTYDNLALKVLPPLLNLAELIFEFFNWRIAFYSCFIKSFYLLSSFIMFHFFLLVLFMIGLPVSLAFLQAWFIWGYLIPKGLNWVNIIDLWKVILILEIFNKSISFWVLPKIRSEINLQTLNVFNFSCMDTSDVLNICFWCQGEKSQRIEYF